MLLGGCQYSTAGGATIFFILCSSLEPIIVRACVSLCILPKGWHFFKLFKVLISYGTKIIDFVINYLPLVRFQDPSQVVVLNHPLANKINK